ncbi:HEPN domain-containing protein [Nonomuraea sp. NPDC050643]|uniref:HEPN domain-containing protein n=1 Tax=Nonomuraea sp. NPDC050643 TaxID=3155660 RepID=UPI0033EE41D3
MISYYSLHQMLVKSNLHGAKKHVYVLNKSVYVLVASLWEAYCEDIVTESVAHMVKYAPQWDALPRALTKVVAKELRNGDTELAPWALAGDGWRTYIEDRLEMLARRREFYFASPKSLNVEKLFKDALGVEDITRRWRTGARFATVCETLDAHIEMRNAVVHRIKPGPTLNKRDVKDFFKIVRRLVRRTDRIVDEMLVSCTGESRWNVLVPDSPSEIFEEVDGKVFLRETSGELGNARGTELGSEA